MDNIELSIKAYIQAQKRLQCGYDKFIMRCKNAGPSTVILLESVEPFAALNEAIFWGISLYERKIKSPGDFMSGISLFMAYQLLHKATCISALFMVDYQ